MASKKGLILGVGILGISAIALMNIMLVSVTERTKERDRKIRRIRGSPLSYLSRRRRRDRWKHAGMFPDEIFQSHLFHPLYIFRDSRFAFELELRQGRRERVIHWGGWRG